MPQTGTAILMAMKSLTTVFVVMLFCSCFCAVSFSEIITPCPKECACEEEYFSESQGVGAKVNCSGKKLKRFPWPLPQVTTTLLLQNNKISKLEGWHFRGMIYLMVLHLEGNRIKKIGETSLGYLPSLHTLYLQNNRIEEMAFRAFRNCSRLKTLNLAKNKLKKLQYAAFDGLDQLDKLDLSGNSISTLEDGAFLGLYRLKTLFLNFNQITKIGPYLFADVYSLTALYLSKNQISVIENGAFSRLLQLRTLSLFDNKISSIPQSLMKGLENLEELYLHRNRINKIEPWSFSATRKLQQLYLYSNLLTFIPDNIFEDLRALRVLHLGINMITYIADGAFRHLGNLNVLYLDSNRLTLLNSRTFEGLSNVKHLHLYFNKISYVGKGGFDHLKKMSRLLWDVPEAYRQTMPQSTALTRGSGLHCDCNARWLKDWLLERGLNDITCATPTKLAGVMVTNLKERDIDCEPLKVSVYPKNVMALFGENVQIQCRTNMGATYHWTLNGARLEADQYRVPTPLGQLTIYGLAEEDLGEYVCIAQNEAGIGASHAMVTVGARPQFTTYPSPVDAREPQRPVVFKCRAKGSPSPQIKWFKDGLLILGTPEESRFHITIEGALVFMGKRFHVTREGSLIIFDPRVEDEGTYKCMAENELGKVSYDVSLYVEMNAKCVRGCRSGGVCTAVKYDCICTAGFHKEGSQCVKDKKTKTKVTEEAGSGSGSGSGPDNVSGSGVESGSGSELPTKPTTPQTTGPGIDDESGSGSAGGRSTLATNGPGVDEEVSGDETSAEKTGSGRGYAEGESDDGSFQTLDLVEGKSRLTEAQSINPLEAPPS